MHTEDHFMFIKYRALSASVSWSVYAL